MIIEPGALLKQINSPDDLRKLDKMELTEVTAQLRQFIIDHVSVFGGHFGASLGVIELTVALHYALQTPTDQIVWDVGHQAYGHKIITGRRDVFHTNRLKDGIAGFPNRAESPYDAFGVGHSSTSISAALGMALASQLQGDNQRQHVAVIGDGALSGGMAFEALNHAGISKSNLLVILNDNNMSIDPNVGGLREYLTDITTSHAYNKVRDEVWRILGKIPKLAPMARELASKAESSIKALLSESSNLFESFGLRYFGPIDGHDVLHLTEMITDLKDIQGPKLLHIITKKGKGFAPAEKDQTLWHAPGKFDKLTGEIFKMPPIKPEPPKYQTVFGETILELARQNKNIIGITPAMPSGSSLNIMMREMPDRAIDVGIAEQHAVTVSAGIATRGLIPFCNIYSTFMQRGYDQVIHDVAIQNLPVIFCLDRAGLVGADGSTHQGAFDLVYMRCLPNMIVSAPMNEVELRNLMYTAVKNRNHPFSIRYPRGKGVMTDWKKPFEEIEIGKGRLITEGDDIALLSIGHIGNLAQKATLQLKAMGISAAHYDMRFVKPIDEELLHHIMTTHKQIITIEDGAIQGGFGSAVLEFAADHNYTIQLKRLGIPDKIIEHGTQQQQYKECGIDTKGIFEAAQQMVNLTTKETISYLNPNK